MEIPFTVITNTVQETEQIGSTLADTLLENSRLPRFIALYGDLGVGKTAKSLLPFYLIMVATLFALAFIPGISRIFGAW